MRRLVAALGAIVVLTAGCMFPQGWHWPRLGANRVETIVYVQSDVVGYQSEHLAWTAGYYNGHPELAIRLVDRCPSGVNCIVARTVDLAYPTVGSTAISFNSSRHLLSSLMRLDPVVGTTGIFNARVTIFHEFCHALGGGFTPAGATSIHELCNWAWRSAIFSEIARVYHDDPG